MKAITYFLQDYAYLRDQMFYFNEMGILDNGRIERKRFTDGERYLRVLDDPTGEHCIIVGGTTTNDNTMEIFDLGSKLVQMGAAKLTLIIPYFSHSTMEREVLDGEVVKAKTRATLLSSIPRASFGNQIFMFDLHADCIKHYFSDTVTTRHFTSINRIEKLVEQYIDPDPWNKIVIASTDVGRAKTVEYICRTSSRFSPAYVYKRRDVNVESTETTGINADVKDQIVVMYDDMVRSGGSLVKAADLYLKHGAKEVHAIVTHGLFVGNCVEAIQGSQIKTFLTSNSHPNALSAAKRTDKIKVFNLFEK